MNIISYMLNISMLFIVKHLAGNVKQLSDTVDKLSEDLHYLEMVVDEKKTKTRDHI